MSGAILCRIFPGCVDIVVTMTSDLALLQDYARNGVQASFSTLVNRHLGLVYSAALRQVRSPELAEEVAQSVFADLARSAARLKPDTIVTAWLYHVTRRKAIDVVRRESRRQLREQVASEMNAMNATADDWTHVEPLLDDAMEALEDTDRAAVLLRYFQNKSLRDLGQELGVSEDAAQKRVSRAVERLREFFAKREVKVGAASLAAAVSANAAQAVPVGLAVTLASSITTGAATAGAAVAATPVIAMTIVQKALVATTVVALAGVGIYEGVQVFRLRDDVRTLQAQQAPLTGQIQQLQSDLSDATIQVSWLRDENERLNRNTAELLRLRGEVGVLRDGQAEIKRLREENAALQASIASNQTSPNPIADLQENQRQVSRMKLFDGRNTAMQLFQFADDNQGWYPTNWRDVTRYTNDYPVSGENSFEMVFKRPFHRDELGTNWDRTIVVREYYAWPTYDGQWGKIYGFADSHSQVVILPDGNFAAWEAENTFNPDSIPR